MGVADTHWMQLAIAQAKLAQAHGEVPVGALVVKEGNILGQGFNQPISSHDPSAHAEMVAIRQACAQVQNYRLVDTTLYVTLEPCMMCTGLMLHARIARIVFGAYDPKVGAMSSPFATSGINLNHRFEVTGGVLEQTCSQLLTDFFKSKRV